MYHILFNEFDRCTVSVEVVCCANTKCSMCGRNQVAGISNQALSCLMMCHTDIHRFRHGRIAVRTSGVFANAFRVSPDPMVGCEH